jgi:hypothetical protein
MMEMIPLQAVPNQTVTILLSDQYCKINVYQKTTGMYIDLFVNNIAIITTKIIRDRLPVVLHEYLGFIGDLSFIDTQGKEDPEYTGIGTRYFLLYLT